MCKDKNIPRSDHDAGLQKELALQPSSKVLVPQVSEPEELS